MHDRDIVQGILVGDQAAMVELIAKYQDLVVNTCFQVLRDPTDAEDLAQEVFIEAYRSMSSLRQAEQLSWWLYRIALNKSINHRRKNRFFRALLRLDSLSQDASCPQPAAQAKDPGQDPYEALIHHEKLQAIRKLLDALPARQQRAFILHHYEQLPYKDIAGILGISLTAVESLIFRARSSLKKKIRAWEEAEKQAFRKKKS